MEETTQTEALPANVVELGGRRITLIPPRSFSVCNEIAQTGSVNLHRAAAAALGVCWKEKPLPRKQRRKKKGKDKQKLRRPGLFYEAHGYNPLQFGGAFQDAMMEAGTKHGFGWGEIYAAGMKAWLLVCDQLPADEDLEEAAGNSERPPAAEGEE